MPLTVASTLELLKERKIKDSDLLFTTNSAGTIDNTVPNECACVALKLADIQSNRIAGMHLCEPKPQKIVMVVEAFRDFDYYHAIKVGEFRKFLEQIEDKSIPICIVTPLSVYSGLYIKAINMFGSNKRDIDSPDMKMRNLLGENIAYLWI